MIIRPIASSGGWSFLRVSSTDEFIYQFLFCYDYICGKILLDIFDNIISFIK